MAKLKVARESGGPRTDADCFREEPTERFREGKTTKVILVGREMAA